MYEQEKKHLKNKITFSNIRIILVVIGIALLILSCFFVDGNHIMEPQDTTKDILEWKVMNSDGTSQDATIPIDFNETGTISIQTKLPKILEGQSLWIKVNFSELTVKIDGEIVYREEPATLGKIRTSVGNYLALVPLKENYSDKSIQIDATVRDMRIVSALKHTTILNKSDYLLNQTKKFIINLVFGIVYIVLGVFMLGVWCHFTFEHFQVGVHSKKLYIYASTFLISFGAWLISDVHLAGIALNELVVSGLINYIAFNLLPIGCMGLACYLYTRTNKIVRWLLGLVEVNFIVECFLFFFGILDFPIMLPITQAMCILSVFTFVVVSAVNTTHQSEIDKKVDLIVGIVSGISLTASVVLYLLDLSIFSWATFASLVIGVWISLKILATSYQMMRDGIRLKDFQNYAYTDALTGLWNRRAFEEDIIELEKSKTEKKFVIASFDVNELKEVNDNLGHSAGDELITGVAKCLSSSFGDYGKIYRIGGDEFIAILYVDDEQSAKLQKELEDTIQKWSGKLVESIEVSCGYVSNSEFSEKKIIDLAKIADRRMYGTKEAYYNNKGIKRRGH